MLIYLRLAQINGRSNNQSLLVWTLVGQCAMKIPKKSQLPNYPVAVVHLNSLDRWLISSYISAVFLKQKFLSR